MGPTICRTAMHSTYLVCQSTDTITMGNATFQASDVELESRLTLSPNCVADTNTCSWTSGCTFNLETAATSNKDNVVALSVRAAPPLAAMMLSWLATLVSV